MESKKRYIDYVWMVKDRKVIPVEPAQANNPKWIAKQHTRKRSLPEFGFAYLEVSMEEACDVFMNIEENLPSLSPEMLLNMCINYKLDVRVQAALLTNLFKLRWWMDDDGRFRHYERFREYKSIEAEATMYAAMLQLCLYEKFDRLKVDHRKDGDYRIWEYISLRH